MDLHDDVKTTTFDLLSEWWKLETDIGIHGCHEQGVQIYVGLLRLLFQV